MPRQRARAAALVCWSVVIVLRRPRASVLPLAVTVNLCSDQVVYVTCRSRTHEPRADAIVDASNRDR
jgi:hypothetical protein